MQKILLTLLLLLFTLSATAKNTILIVGDSISAGYGLNINDVWVKQLQSKITEKGYDYHVVNASVSGDTTSNGLAKLPKLLSQYQPAITIIELGGNDGLRGIQLMTIKHNLLQMTLLAKAAGSKVLLLGLRLPPNYGPDYISQFQQVYSQIARDQDVSLVSNMLNGIDDHAALMQADRIHPNANAQALILTNLWPELEKILKLVAN